MAARRTSRRDRVLFPLTGFRKSDALAYYEAIAPLLLPHLRNRPISFKRYPNTINDESFWEKDAPSFTPDWVRRIAVPRRHGGADIDYIAVNDLRTLLWLVDVGAVELHAFSHRAPRIDVAREVVLDLDPGRDADVVTACGVALLLREELELAGLSSWVKTTGSKGLQIYIPIGGNASHALTESFARTLAEVMARRHPKSITARMALQHRTGRVFIDYSQNADYKTNVSVYSLRAKRQEPFVSTPLRWEEVEQAVKRRKAAALDFTPSEVIKRTKRIGDLFDEMKSSRQKLPSPFVKEFERQRVPVERKGEEHDSLGMIVKGIRLPKPRSQSGRRLFVLTSGESGNELWIDVAGKFKRWILRPDARGGEGLVAMPAGQFPVHESYFRGEVQSQYRQKVKIDDIGTYETIEGSLDSEDVALYFTGHTLLGEWRLRKIEPGTSHRSWELRPN